MLRTTQWTRASLILGLRVRGQKQCFDAVAFGSRYKTIGHVPASGARVRVSEVGTRFILMYVVSSFEEQTVDALATGAEEGRSNLR